MLKRLRSSSLIRSIAVVASGTAIAQAIAFAVTPILSRLYTPDQYGLFGSFVSIAGVLIVISALRLDLAVVVPEKDEDAANVVLSGVFVSAATALLTTLVLVLLALNLAPDRAGLGLYGWLPLTVAMGSTLRVMTQWLARGRAFRAMAHTRVVQTSSAQLAQLTTGLIAPSSASLVFGQMLGFAFGVARATGAALRHQPWLRKHRIDVVTCVNVITQYRNFTTFGAFQGLVNAMNLAAPVLMLSLFFGAEPTGFYVMAYRVLAVPMQLVGHSLRQVIYPRLREDLARNLADRTVRRVTLVLGLLAVPAVAALAVFGRPLFLFVLGDAWATAGTYAGIIGIWLGAAFVNIPSIAMIPLLGLQRRHAVFEVVHLVARVTVMVVAARVGDAMLGIVAISVVGVLFNVSVIAFVGVAMRARRLNGPMTTP